MVSQEVIKFVDVGQVVLEYAQGAHEWTVEINDEGNGDLWTRAYVNGVVSRRNEVHVKMLHAHGYTMFK